MVTIIYYFAKTGTRRTVVPSNVVASHLRSIKRNGGEVIEVIA